MTPNSRFHEPVRRQAKHGLLHLLHVDVDPNTAQSTGHPRSRLEAEQGNGDVAAAEVPDTVSFFCEDNAPGSCRVLFRKQHVLMYSWVRLTPSCMGEENPRRIVIDTSDFLTLRETRGRSHFLNNLHSNVTGYKPRSWIYRFLWSDTDRMTIERIGAQARSRDSLLHRSMVAERSSSP